MSNGHPGLGVDAQGNPVVDPTQNVIDLVEAGMQRQDDLREQESAHVRQLMEIRDQRIALESTHLRELMALEGQHATELRQAESARIDAIRTVDVGNVSRAAEVAAAQATALATQLANSAEALRAQVEATRITTAQTLAAALEPIQKDVSELRQVQFQQQGERAQATETRSEATVTRGTAQWAIGATISAVLVVIAIVGFLISHYH